MKPFFLAIAILVQTSCFNKKDTQNTEDLSSEKNIKIKLIDSIRKGSDLYDIYSSAIYYSGGTLPTQNNKASYSIFNNKLYALKNFHDISVLEFISGSNQNSFYTYNNGEVYKMFAAVDKSKINCYNLNKGIRELTVEDPFNCSGDLTKKILYVDSNLIFVLKDSTSQGAGQSDLHRKWYKIYRYDISSGVKSIFHESPMINNYGDITNRVRYYINKISKNDFLFAASNPTFETDGSNITSVYSFIKTFDSKDIVENHQTSSMYYLCESSSLEFIPDSYGRFSFLISNVWGKKTDLSRVMTPYKRELFSLNPISQNFSIHKGLEEAFGAVLNIQSIGDLFVCSNSEACVKVYLTDDLKNFKFLKEIPFGRAFKLFFIAHLNQYYLLEREDQQIYIYEVKNLS